MKTGTDPDMFLFGMYQLRNKICDLEEVVFAEGLTLITLEACQLINIQT